MIDFYFWTTPNGFKVLMYLEETGLDYNIRPVNISKGEQFEPEFLKISPNNKMPAIIDRSPPGGGAPLAIFESGAILEYLADKTGQLLPTDIRRRYQTLQWLYWQMAGLGPMLGQNLHFGQYAPERIKYAINRYKGETRRLFQVLDNRLADRPFVAGGEYSIADIASYPWVYKQPFLEVEIDEFPNLKCWFDQVAARPATERAYAIGAKINTTPTMTEEAKKILLGQDAESVAA